MSISTITSIPQDSRFPASNVGLTFQKTKSVIITAVALYALSTLQMVSAGQCEESQEICVRSCRGGDPRSGGACLVGCAVAYFFCKMFVG